ncbi:Mitochondrial ribonuclease P catalytic subunit [Formica fusca]
MGMFCKIYRPLWSWHCKFHRSAYFLLDYIPNSRKTIPLNVIIAENTDIYKKIKGNENIEWASIREKFLQIQQITPAIVDSTIIDICLKNFQVDTAIAYFKYLRENNYPLNVAVIGKYLRLYFLKRKSLTDIDKTEIVETYNALRKQHPYLDSVTAEHCVVSLCLTDQWEKTYEIMEMMKITTSPGTSVYSALASAAFRNGKPDIAWKALLEITSRKLIPQNIVYTSHLQYCELEEQIFNDRMEEMFKFWAEHSIRPYNRVISAYIDAATKYGWSAAPTTISTTGSCRHCGHSLLEITFSEKNFRDLAESIMKRVIVGSDIYCKTNPQELQRFKKFIEETKPYDIVIDGLNMTYIRNNYAPVLQTLNKVIDYFSKRGQKILVLTRKHQKKLPIFKYIEQRALVFLTDNLSVDDPYLLYATISSGKNAKFVSLDLMRQHKHSLKDMHLQREFRKWQCSHQYFVMKSANGIHIQEPFVYMPTVQKNGDCWHVPYVNDDFTYAESYEFPDKWYCLKYNKSK